MAEKEPPSRVLCGVLALFFGGWGVHKFVMGNSKAGIIQILSNILCCAGSFIGLIEGIMYLTKSDEEFHQTYFENKKDWF